MDATSTIPLFTDFLGDIGQVLLSVIPDVLLVGAALIGLMFGIRWVKKFIGRGK